MSEFWSDFLLSVGSSLAVALVTGIVVFLFTKRYLNTILFAAKLRRYGFKESITDKDINAREKEKIYGHADVIKIIYVSGNGFFSNQSNINYLSRALGRGAEIQVLLASICNPFLDDIVSMEVNSGKRASGTTIDTEADNVHNIILGLKKQFPDGKLNVRYFSTEYRLPFVLAEFNKREKLSDERYLSHIMSWTHLTMPPDKSSKHFMMRAEKHYNNAGDYGEDFNVCEMQSAHFKAIWDQSVEWDDMAAVYWNNKYRASKDYMDSIKDKNNRVLIVLSAQHPLFNGTQPGKEFTARLDMGIQLYNTLKSGGKEVKIYVPGSVHKPDSISLSKCGADYLTKNNIPAEDIYAEDANQRFKGSDGVYNSADECYVGAELFKDGDYSHLIDICSPMQTIKKMLFYIEQGIIPDLRVAATDDYYHNPVYEASVVIPYILRKDHSWQVNSAMGKRSREERKP